MIGNLFYYLELCVIMKSWLGLINSKHVCHGEGQGSWVLSAHADGRCLSCWCTEGNSCSQVMHWGLSTGWTMTFTVDMKNAFNIVSRQPVLQWATFFAECYHGCLCALGRVWSAAGWPLRSLAVALINWCPAWMQMMSVLTSSFRPGTLMM